MNKFLILTVLVGILVFYLYRLIKQRSSSLLRSGENQGFVLIAADNTTVNRTIRSTLTTAVIGLGILVLVGLLGMKVKILFILLPIGFYLVGHLFLLANHINSVNKQKIWYHPQQSVLFFEDQYGNKTSLRILQDIKLVVDIKAIQSTRGVLYGYYALKTDSGIFRIPYLITKNNNNKFLFDYLLDCFPPKQSTTLYPMV